MMRKCSVCMHGCALKPGQTGLCGARKNQRGEIVSSSYGKITALALDPIEKKPLRRFFPGSMILSAGSYGCNLKCPFCQNHNISMCRGFPGAMNMTPGQLVEKAKELESRGNIGIAFTYNEPLIGFEFVRDTARMAKEKGLKTAVVTNGSVTARTAEEILPCIDAMNIDLKGFSPKFYEKLGGDLPTVQAFIRMAAERCHVELTTLIIPGENDSPREMELLSGWVASVDPKIPLHVTRFFPQWKMADKKPTPVETVKSLAAEAGKRLETVFVGNC